MISLESHMRKSFFFLKNKQSQLPEVSWKFDETGTFDVFWNLLKQLPQFNKYKVGPISMTKNNNQMKT